MAGKQEKSSNRAERGVSWGVLRVLGLFVHVVTVVLGFVFSLFYNTLICGGDGCRIVVALYAARKYTKHHERSAKKHPTKNPCDPPHSCGGCSKTIQPTSRDEWHVGKKKSQRTNTTHMQQTQIRFRIDALYLED